ncbi:hypothetical protein HHI36_017446 [Cryptolaemus montrouzieri]|uniref:Uncharacterized protein n=1 Tax=Cryptolaemus montrouzieri TaxID=559131 RepID=A0ABD2NMV1_9CUCU
MTSIDLKQDLSQQQSVPKVPDSNQPYRLTFFIENETDARGLQLTDFSQSHLRPEQYYEDLVVEGYENPQDRIRHPRHVSHEPQCVLSAFLYFITITTIVYLAIMWVKRQMHIRMEQLQWW